MSSRDIVDLDPALQSICREFLAQCKDAHLDCTYRSCDEQDDDFAHGRTIPGKKITNAKGGESAHNCMVDEKPSAKAFDIYITNPDGTLNWDTTSEPWKKAVEVGESLGLVAGARWHIADWAHFELPNWRKL